MIDLSAHTAEIIERFYAALRERRSADYDFINEETIERIRDVDLFLDRP